MNVAGIVISPVFTSENRRQLLKDGKNPSTIGEIEGQEDVRFLQSRVLRQAAKTDGDCSYCSNSVNGNAGDARSAIPCLKCRRQTET